MYVEELGCKLSMYVIACKRCGSKLKYHDNDIVTHVRYDANMTLVESAHIICPICSERIVLSEHKV